MSLAVLRLLTARSNHGAFRPLGAEMSLGPTGHWGELTAGAVWSLGRIAQGGELVIGAVWLPMYNWIWVMFGVTCIYLMGYSEKLRSVHLIHLREQSLSFLIFITVEMVEEMRVQKNVDEYVVLFICRLIHRKTVWTFQCEKYFLSGNEAGIGQ